jgi:diacylglycerol kinase (ATP)
LKTRFIFNPRSGRNARDPRLLRRVRDFIRDNDLDALLVQTERPRHATELARRAVDEGCTLVVAVGGDGTLNEVASGLVGTPVPLGLIPCGSGNGLGRHLGIPSPGRGAFRTLLEGRQRSIDTGTVNGIPFFNAMGIGFDAEISSRFNRLTRRGLPAYALTTFRAFRGFHPVDCTIHAGATSLRTPAFLLAIANSDQYGNDCFIAPGARVDDGRLDLTVLTRVTLWNAVPLGLRLFARRIDGSRSVVRLAGQRFLIERDGPGVIHTDGEVHETGATLTVEVLPRSLKVLVPASSLQVPTEAALGSAACAS